MPTSNLWPSLMIASAIWLAALCSLCASGPEYSRTRDLPSVQISEDDLNQILEKATAFVARANGPRNDQAHVSESIKVGNGGDQITVPGASLRGVRLPKVELSFRYAFDQYEKPISSIEIDFDDLGRKLLVKGEAVEEVEALSILLENAFLEYSSIAGGSSFRSAAGISAVLLLMIILLASASLTVHFKNAKALAIVVFCSLSGEILIMILPFKQLFPGFALYNGEVSFLRRYGAEISFIGVLITTIGIPLSYYLPLWFRKPAQQADRSQKDKSLPSE